MKYTPFDNHTTDELVREVLNKDNPTDLELALMERIEHLQYELEEMEAVRLGEITGAPI